MPKLCWYFEDSEIRKCTDEATDKGEGNKKNDKTYPHKYILSLKVYATMSLV